MCHPVEVLGFRPWILIQSMIFSLLVIPDPGSDPVKSGIVTPLVAAYFVRLLPRFQYRELMDSVVHNRPRRGRPPLLPLLLLLHQVRLQIGAASFGLSRPFYRFSKIIEHES